MNKRLDELIGVIKSWVGWFDWNEAQREVLKDVLFNLEKARRVEELEEELNRHNIVMESFRVDELEQQNKRYRESIKKAIAEFNQDERHHGMAELIKALEGEE